MVDYATYLRQIISRKDYNLDDLESRITCLWIEGKVSDDDREELIRLAAENANDAFQIDIVAKFCELEHRIWELEHPTDVYRIWTPRSQTSQHEIVRYDVTGDGELDLCQYNGGRASTVSWIGGIDGWNLLDRELNVVAVITRNADKNFIITPVEAEPEPEADGDSDGANTEG